MSFEEFIKAKQEKAGKKPPFDKESRIKEFKGYVEWFYEQLENLWLAGYFDSLQPRFENITIREELLGDYQVRALTLTVGDDEIHFKPFGTMLIGSCGRIDVTCGDHKARFIMVGEKARTPQALFVISINGEKPPKRDYGKLVWKLVDERGMMSFVDLTPDVIQRLIMKLAE